MWYETIFQKLLEQIKIQCSNQKPRDSSREIKIAVNQPTGIIQQPIQATSKKVQHSIPIRNVFLFLDDFELEQQ